MVAETETAKKPKPKGRLSEIPLLLKIKARNLYLVEGLSWPEIGQRCGWDYDALSQCASREGWTVEKRRRKALLLQKADARMSQTSSEVLEAIASKSEEAALKAMSNVDAALDRSDEFAAKDFQAYTAGVKNLASTARMLREDSSGSKVEGTRMELNLFFMGQQVANAQPKQAEVVEVESVKSVQAE